MIPIKLEDFPSEIQRFLHQKQKQTNTSLSALVVQYAEIGARRELGKVVPLHPEQSAYSPGD